MSNPLQVLKDFCANRADGDLCSFGQLDLSHWFSTRQVCAAQEGGLFQGSPTWRYRVLKTALRLRPRRALSSAPGQNSIVAQNYSQMKNCSKILKLLLTNHIPVFRGSAQTFLYLLVPAIALRRRMHSLAANFDFQVWCLFSWFGSFLGYWLNR